MKIRRITDILHPAAKALAAAFLTVSAMALLTVGCTRPRGVPEEGTPDDPAISGLEYEVKFLLDPNQVLDGNHLLKPEWQTFFGITEEPLPIDVLYLETSKRDFQEEGWNRI